MNTNTKITKILIAAAVAFLLCSSVQASDIIYSRPLTSGPNVNANPPSNNAYNTAQNGIAAGDLLGGDVQNNDAYDWWPMTLSVWAVGPVDPSLGPNGVPSAFPWTTLTLYGGDYANGAGTIATLATTTTGVYAPYVGAGDGSTNYSATYGNPVTPAYAAVWKLTFNVTGLEIAQGEDFWFGVSDGTPSDLQLNATQCSDPTLGHADACVSMGIDEFTPGGAPVGSYDMWTTGPGQTPPNALISSDVNVELDAPEPTTLLLFGAGLGILGLARRRRG